MISATSSIDLWQGSLWICVRRYRLMPSVPQMTKAPQNSRFQAIISCPAIVNLPCVQIGNGQVGFTGAN